MSGRLLRALLAAALLLPCAAQAEVHLRLVPQLRAGGGWASDPFLGANLEPSVEGQVAPSLRLDVSLAPAVKLWTEYDFALGLYQATQSPGLSHLLELGSRFRLGGAWVLDLALSGEDQELAVSQSLNELVGLEASSTRGVGASPALRLVDPRFSFEALYRFEANRIELSSGRVDDLSHLGAATASVALGPTWLTVSAQALSESASIPEFSYRSASLHLGYAIPLWGASAFKLSGSAHLVEFDTGRADTLLRGGVGASFALTDFLFLEPTYGYALNRSSDRTKDARRHFVYLGLRAQGEVWRL